MTVSTNTIDLPTSADLRANPESKQELVTRLYPKLAYHVDYALPQPWVDHYQNMYGFDTRGCFVWAYSQGSIFGEPLPLTVEARDFLDILRQRKAARA